MTDRKKVAIWLLTGVFLVIAMVVIGGITRLTHSGLSMVNWKPISGTIPPLNEAEWMAEFENYKTSPEYKIKNYHFTVEEFKSIFWWEYIHRLLGRVIGFVFLIPFLYFLFTKKLKDKRLLKNLVVIFFLGGLQGFIGWFMVKSGLVNDPNVSHFRLAIHFITALFLCCYILWIALKLLYPEKGFIGEKLKSFKTWTNIAIIITVIQIIYGAFVAGLKAGLIYGTFPKMGGDWIASEIPKRLDQIGILTFIEDSASVQFIHRWIAVVVVFAIVVLIWKAKKVSLKGIQFKLVTWLGIIVVFQFVLGVMTLLMKVPVTLGVLHQLGAVVLLITLVITRYFFRGKNKPFTV
ncbi:COX15/CtaA family protein [Aureivirga marina]|uniref:COX15/CtaA family protein n=1 Tax=Aureivirga marina TaxID=1182451 RepID=UPI0018CB33D4|nr:COX15/CtaA family protein [Aureivirga marina]